MHYICTTNADFPSHKNKHKIKKKVKLNKKMEKSKKESKYASFDAGKSFCGCLHRTQINSLSFKRSQGLVSIFLPQRNAVNANNSNTNGNKQKVMLSFLYIQYCLFSTFSVSLSGIRSKLRITEKQPAKLIFGTVPQDR